MKPVTAALLIALLTFGLGLYLPWWTAALAGGLVAIILNLHPLPSFLAGFSAVFLLWGSLAFLRSTANEHLLAQRMASFILKNDSPLSLIFVTALIGGLVAGMGSITGSLLRNWQSARRS